MAAENPVILAGRAARTPAGLQLMVELAETLQAGVVDSRRRLNFPTRHPLSGGSPGQADVVLALEAGDISNVARQARQRNAKVISITADASLPAQQLPGRHALRRGRHVDRGRRRSDAAGADRGDQAPDDRRTRREAFRQRGVRVAEANRSTFERARTDATYGWDASPVSTARLSMELWAQLKNEDWSYVTGWVNWPLRLWDFDKHYQYIGRAGAEGVGYYAPASVGAALANKKHGRISVSIQPDGDLMVAPGALWTAAQSSDSAPDRHAEQPRVSPRSHVVPARRRCCATAASSSRKTGFGLGDPNIDFAKMAESMGVGVVGTDLGSEGSCRRDSPRHRSREEAASRT